MASYLFKSERLGFRQWEEADFDTLYQLCSDPEVMEFFPTTLTREETQALFKRLQKTINDTGIGFFAVDVLASKELIGFIGAIHQTMDVDFTPCVEIGWRLKKESWGFGYATEGAKACLKFVFESNITNEIYSFTPIKNKKSENVMLKIGMHHKGYFDHPLLAPDSRLLSHSLYHISKSQFSKIVDI